MVDHILEVRGYKVLFTGQITPLVNIEKVFEVFRPERVYVSSTIIKDVKTVQTEFDRLCNVGSEFGASLYIGGHGFDLIDHKHPLVTDRLFSFKDVFEK